MTQLAYQAMLEQMTDSIIFADEKGVIRFWNTASKKKCSGLAQPKPWDRVWTLSFPKNYAHRIGVVFMLRCKAAKPSTMAKQRAPKPYIKMANLFMPKSVFV